MPTGGLFVLSPSAFPAGPRRAHSPKPSSDPSPLASAPRIGSSTGPNPSVLRFEYKSTPPSCSTSDIPSRRRASASFHLTLPFSFPQPTSLFSRSAVSTVARSRRLPVFPHTRRGLPQTLASRPFASKVVFGYATRRYPVNRSSHRDRCSSTSATALRLAWRRRACYTFPGAGLVSTDTPDPNVAQTSLANHVVTIYMPDHADSAGQNIDNESSSDQDPTPRASHDLWRLTPSLIDPNLYACNSGDYTPILGSNNFFSHPQAGELHTPPLVMAPGLGKPLLMPTTADGPQSGVTTIDRSGPQSFQTHQFYPFNPSIQGPRLQPYPTPPCLAHHDKSHGPTERDAPLGSSPSDSRMQSMATAVNAQTFASVTNGQPLPASAKKFRFHSTLNALTAMIKNAHEIPVAYLNKEQAYSLSITDTSGTIPVWPGTKYRTFVRVSFDDETRRQEPNEYWGFWKKRRGTNEALQRGGKLQAIEFAERCHGSGGDDQRTRIELETAFFDGFSVIWSPGLNGAPNVDIAVRFNFVSTDFSHSTGVKGILMRLCTKTTLVSPTPTPDTSPEICFCKIQVFRGRSGARRKLSDDAAPLRRSMKLKQQLCLSERGTEDPRKRQRGSRAAELQALHAMLNSTRDISVLSLRGDKLDDPDLYQVTLPSSVPSLDRTDGAEIWVKVAATDGLLLRFTPDTDEAGLSQAYLSHEANPSGIQRPHRQKWGLDASKIAMTSYVIQDGLEAEIDDDVVRELGEGQQTRLEVETTEQQRPSKGAKKSVDGLAEDGVAGGLVLRLKF
ncbi:transcriptional regulator family: CP2 [Purpureocillium lilacinum]|uniref:Transcriptional regulator family: CP2 n=1 Tax=Purpureocillium lilacinum TaxID=33203 RepID=A0ABR0BE79_PURLI|nr:transcriptional regulator family: CP2 [Purpureocillium lilacinum]